MKTLHFAAFLVTAAHLLHASSAAAQTPRTAVTLQNSSFGIPLTGTVPGTPVTTLAVCTGDTPGSSASAGWTTYANTARTDITSWIVTAPGGYTSNLVSVGGGQNGLVQRMVAQNTPTDVNRVSGRVYVVAGQVALQLGNGGSGGGDNGVSTALGGWQYISACGRPDMLNNQVTIYGVGPAVFYVDDVNVDFSSSCPSCDHPYFDVGAPLSPDCGSCYAQVCAADPYCCSVWWDSICVDEADPICF
jgi:hypothetical protein